MQSEGGVGVRGLEPPHQLVAGQLSQLQRRWFIGSDGIQGRRRRRRVAVVLDQDFPQQGLDVVIGAADHDRQFLLGMNFADLQADREEATGEKWYERSSTCLQIFLCTVRASPASGRLFC